MGAHGDKGKQQPKGNMMVKALLVLAAAGVHATAPPQETHTLPWLYLDVNERGPADWSGIDSANALCNEGVRQSPVNIRNARVNTELRELEFHYDTVPAGAYSVVNTQSAIEIHFDSSPGHFIDPNVEMRFDVDKIVFHSPSEHTFGGGRYPLEMQVHHTAIKDDDDKQFDVGIVSVLFNTALNNKQLNAFWSNLPWVPLGSLENFADASATFSFNYTEPTAPMDIPINNFAYFTYEGSLTEPPCTEHAKWYVMQELSAVSTQQLKAFREAMQLDEKTALAASDPFNAQLEPFTDYGNSRPVQELHGRVLQAFSGARRVADLNAEDDDEAFPMAIIGLVCGSLALAMLCLSAFYIKWVTKTSKEADADDTEPVN
ncbi:Alpha carbonic anhydrase 7 [Diplonema papillatum]|nr:Alpha carbonic anhydrase 7 [Diplonema papillatum]